MAEKTGGNPFLLTELVGCFDPDTDSFQALQIPQVIQRKLQRLPEDAGRLLEVIAVSGKALSMEEASLAAGHSTSAVSTLTHMRTENLVRMIGHEESPVVDTYHDKIRESVIHELPNDTRQKTHLAIAETIENEGTEIIEEVLAAIENGQSTKDDEYTLPRLNDLAYHFDEAGEKRKAWVYSLLAAEQARRQFALAVAISRYESAQRNAADSTRAVRFRITEGLGEVLVLTGQYEPAKKVLESASELADEPHEKAVILAHQADSAYARGTMTESIDKYEQVLRHSGKWVPRTRLGVAIVLGREALVQVMHRAIPRSWYARKTVMDARQSLMSRALTKAPAPYAFVDLPRFFWSQLAAVNHAEKFADSSALADAYALPGGAMSGYLGWGALAESYFHRSLKIALELDDKSAQVRARRFRGFGLFARGRLDKALDSLTKAMSIAEELGDAWPIVFARMIISQVHFRSGNLADGIRGSRTLFEMASSRGVGRVAQMMIQSWSFSAAGNLPLDGLKNSFEAVSDDVTSTIQMLTGELCWHLFHHRTEQALEIAEKAARLEKTFGNFASTTCARSLLARTLREHAESIRTKDPQESDRLLKRGLAAARSATRVSTRIRVDYPTALRERSLLLAATGRTRQALNFAQKSCLVAAEQNARYELAQSQLASAKLSHELGLPDAAQQIEAAEIEMAKFQKMIDEAIK